MSSHPIPQTMAGKVAVISGSSSGIGAEIARELASRGANVVVNYPFPHLKEEGEAVVAQLSTPGIVLLPHHET
jgi:NAD(P)-dependent dehydrogenase (short-subunit alcohol dehydrogenase family)